MRIRPRGWLLATIATLLLGTVGGVAGEAFTLIAVASLTVKPTQGLSSATFVVDGVYKTSVCTATPPPFTFYFYWGGALPGHQIWKAVVVTTCDTATLAYDTGPSPKLLPPAAFAKPGTHQVEVAVFTAAGAPAPGNSTAIVNYKVLTPPPPSPSPRPSPTPTHRPVPTPVHRPSPTPRHSPSPTPASCAAPTAAIGSGGPAGPTGYDVVVMLALVLLGTVPVGGLAMISSPLSARRRQELSRLTAIMGLSLVLTAATGCTALRAPIGQAPIQTASPSASPSPSPTPTC